jgi:hypothetical protein
MAKRSTAVRWRITWQICSRTRATNHCGSAGAGSRRRPERCRVERLLPFLASEPGRGFYRNLGDWRAAREHLARARDLAGAPPDNGYANMIRRGIAYLAGLPESLGVDIQLLDAHVVNALFAVIWVGRVRRHTRRAASAWTAKLGHTVARHTRNRPISPRVRASGEPRQFWRVPGSVPPSLSVVRAVLVLFGMVLSK